MDLGLNGRIAVVMASSRGLGRASALALAQEGCDLAICSRNRESIEKAAAEIRAVTQRRVLAHVVNVTDPRAIDEFAAAVEAEYGAVDVLVNNSGGPPPGTFDSLDIAGFQQGAELLLLNVIRVTKAFLPLIRKAKRGGRILTITSTSVRQVIPDLMLSNCLRAAVTGWSKTLARELAPENILVNCVAPGAIQTERGEDLMQATIKKTGKTREQLVAEMLSGQPMGRIGRPDEFAAAVAFLASQRASYISGITLYVDGAKMTSVV